MLLRPVIKSEGNWAQAVTTRLASSRHTGVFGQVPMPPPTQGPGASPPSRMENAREGSWNGGNRQPLLLRC